MSEERKRCYKEFLIFDSLFASNNLDVVTMDVGADIIGRFKINTQ